MKTRDPQIGDVLSVGAYALGRVVSTSAVVGPTHGCMLVYVYRDRERPSRDDLLVPPLLTTRAPWSRGLFAFVRSQPLLPKQYFERHCFRDAQGRLVDEEGRPMDAPPPGVPIGDYALQSVDAVEAALATALSSSSSRRRTSRSSRPPRGTRTRTRKSRSP